MGLKESIFYVNNVYLFVVLGPPPQPSIIIHHKEEIFRSLSFSFSLVIKDSSLRRRIGVSDGDGVGGGIVDNVGDGGGIFGGGVV